MKMKITKSLEVRSSIALEPEFVERLIKEFFCNIYHWNAKDISIDWGDYGECTLAHKGQKSEDEELEV